MAAPFALKLDSKGGSSRCSKMAPGVGAACPIEPAIRPPVGSTPAAVATLDLLTTCLCCRVPRKMTAQALKARQSARDRRNCVY